MGSCFAKTIYFHLQLTVKGRSDRSLRNGENDAPLSVTSKPTPDGADHWPSPCPATSPQSSPQTPIHYPPPVHVPPSSSTPGRVPQVEYPSGRSIDLSGPKNKRPRPARSAIRPLSAGPCLPDHNLREPNLREPGLGDKRLREPGIGGERLSLPRIQPNPRVNHALSAGRICPFLECPRPWFEPPAGSDFRAR